jgi:hypothetical protein
MHDVSTTTARTPTDEDIDAIAAEVRCHRQSVLRRLAGLEVRGRVSDDIDRALVARGLRLAEAI